LGTAAHETVNVGGLTVKGQEIGVVNRAAWFGDGAFTLSVRFRKFIDSYAGINSGLMGLAYPGLTSVFKGTNASADHFPNSNTYDPVPFSAVKKNLIKTPSTSILPFSFSVLMLLSITHSLLHCPQPCYP
jgi:hypothetical protein